MKVENKNRFAMLHCQCKNCGAMRIMKDLQNNKTYCPVCRKENT